jgi:UDP-N-acetylglucosamine:(glucosyl)LPS alpha-1,2-N-acetylglucosaminyltransferase
MSKKVLMVAGPVHTNPPLKGAAVETWMYEVSKRLIGYEPHIVSISHPFYPLKEYRDGIYFHRIRFGRLYKRLFQKITKFDPLSYPKRINRIIDEVKPDIVHMHNSIKWFVPVVEHLKNRNIKAILHMHNVTDVTAQLEVDAFVGCSNFIVESYKETPIKASYYKYLYNGVDLNRFKPIWETDALRNDIRGRFGINKGDFVVLFVGRVSPEKGVEHFIQSALLLKDTKNIRFIATGEISEKGDRREYADKIISMAASIRDKITFTGVFPPSKIHLIYLLGDVVVLPSNFEEPFSMVAIEAMASGLPVITRKKGGIKEYLIDGVNGFFVDEERVSEDTALKIKTIMTDKSLKERISYNGRKTVEERFGWESIAADTENLYKTIFE